MEQTNEPTLNLPTDHDVISKPMEQAMIEAVATSRRARVDHKKEWYVKRVGELENECSTLKKELSEIRGRRKTSIWERIYQHSKERSK